MKKYIFLLLLLIATTANSAPPQRQTTYTSGTTIRSADVTDNEDEIFGYLQTGVDTIRTDGLNAITEIESSLKSGSDQSLITGTAGSDEQLGVWNSDGDIVGLSTLTGDTTGIKMSVDLAITGLANCDTIDTGSDGILRCGSDDGGSETNSLETTITGILDTEIFIGTGADTGNFASISGDGSLANDGTLTVNDDSHAHVITDVDSFTSAELRTQLSDESGSGAAIFAAGDVGAATATTPAANDDDTSVATTAYVQTEINALGGTNLTCASGSCDVDDAFLVNDANDTSSAGLTITGLIATTSLEVETLTSCDSVDTLADGSFVCGTDAGGTETNSLETITTGIASTEIPIGTAADTVVYNALSGDATMDNGGVVTVVDDSHNHVWSNIDSDTSSTFLGQISDEDGSGLCTAGVLCIGGHEHAGANLTDDIFLLNNANDVSSAGLTLTGLIATTSLEVETLTSCDSVDTLADGSFVCGTDETGAGGGDPILIDGTGVTDGSGVDLQGGADITITFDSGASPDTASFAVDDAFLQNDVNDTSSAGLTLTGLVATTALQDESNADCSIVSSSSDGTLGCSTTADVRWLVFNLVEASTDVAVATNIAGDFLSPIAGTILQQDTTPFYLYATNSTAGTTGTMVVDISIGGTSIMTTNKLDFDTTEKTTTTAATFPDLTTTELKVGDIITIDVDAIHTTAAKGLTVYMGIRE